MAIAEVQAGDNVGAASGSPQTVFGSNTTLGHCVVLCIVLATQGSQTVSSVSSSIGTFSHVVSETPGGSTNPLEIWVCTNVTGAAEVVTVTTSGGSSARVQATEWSGVLSASTGGGATATSTSCSLTVTPNETGDALVVMASTHVAFTGGPSAPWTDYNAGEFVRSNGLDVAWQVSSGLSGQAATWPLTPSTVWNAVGVILKPVPPPSSGFMSFT